MKGSEGSPTSTEKPAEDYLLRSEPDHGEPDHEKSEPDHGEPDHEQSGPVEAITAGQVTLINGKKVGCVFPEKDQRVKPGETYRVSQEQAKIMEQIPGQRRQ